MPASLDLALFAAARVASLAKGGDSDAALAEELRRAKAEFEKALARAAEEKRLAFGPFAFRLSPSSEVLAWLLATRLRAKLKGARVLEVGLVSYRPDPAKTGEHDVAYRVVSTTPCAR